MIKLTGLQLQTARYKKNGLCSMRNIVNVYVDPAVIYVTCIVSVFYVDDSLNVVLFVGFNYN